MSFISIPFLLAGVMLIEDKGGHTMAKTELLAEMNIDIPLMDKDVPAVIETATFALG
jgi:hypothetical protein